MNEMEYEIDLRELFEIIKRRFWIIVTMAVVASFVSAIVSFYFLDPIYETKTTLIVVKEQGQDQSMQYNDVVLSQKLVKTYGEIVKSRTIAKEVIDNLALGISADTLIKQVSVNPVSDTEIISIAVQGTDPELITKMANELASVFMHRIVGIMSIDNVQVIDPAETPMNPIKPRIALNIAIAAVLGLMLGVGIVFLMEFLDDTLKTPEDIEKHLKLPVIGIIPFDTEINTEG